jgi:hypothetical protein
MLVIRRKGFSITNGALNHAYNVKMNKTNKGIHIVGINNNKIINKTIKFKKNKRQFPTKKRKVIRKK